MNTLLRQGEQVVVFCALCLHVPQVLADSVCRLTR